MNPRIRLDELNKALLLFGGVCYLISFVLGRSTAGSTVFRLLFAVAAVLVLLRMFGRNEAARYRENAKFLATVTAVREYFRRPYKAAGQRPVQQAGEGIWNKWKQKWRAYRTYRYLICPQCSQRLRVPRGKGRIRVTCTKCRNQFMAKS